MTPSEEYRLIQDRLILIMSGRAPKSGKGALMRRLKVLYKLI